MENSSTVISAAASQESAGKLDDRETPKNREWPNLECNTVDEKRVHRGKPRPPN